MNIYNAIYEIFNPHNENPKKNIIAKGVGYEMSYDDEKAFIYIKLIGKINYKLITHLKEQLLLSEFCEDINHVMIEISESAHLQGNVWNLRKRDIKKIGINNTVILLSNWSYKKKIEKVLKFLGLSNIHFFFSIVSAFNWIKANKSAR